MTPAEFLSRWRLEHINSGTQQTDAPKLSGELLHDAALEGIGRDELEMLAGKPLENYIVDSIREAIEEELW